MSRPLIPLFVLTAIAIHAGEGELPTMAGPGGTDLAVMLVRQAPLERWDLNEAGWTWRWSDEAAEAARAVTLPYHVANKKSKHDHAVYRLEHDFPAIGEDERLDLVIGAMEDGGEVCVDGRGVALVDFNGYLARIDLTPHVGRDGGEHVLELKPRWRHAWGDRVFPFGHNFSQCVGLPRGVWLEKRPAVAVVDCWTEADVAKNTLTVRATVANASREAVELTVGGTFTSWNGDDFAYPAVAGQAVTVAAGAHAEVTIGPLAWTPGKASWWWPNIPYRAGYVAKLHVLDLALTDAAGKERSRCAHRFGFVQHGDDGRSFTVNGVRVLQFTDSTQESLFRLGAFQERYGAGTGNMVAWSHLEGFHPGDAKARTGGIYDTWRKYLTIGINTMRLHNSAPWPHMVATADELGFLLAPESMLRGGANQGFQVWNDRHVGRALRVMARLHRANPSICRYSLHNEWGDDDGADVPKMIDAIVMADATRPLSVSTHPHDTQAGRIAGEKSKAHAWRLAHYRFPKVDRKNPSLVGVEEFAWWVGNPETGMGAFAKQAVMLRERGYALIGPWCIGGYWPDFYAGASYANGIAKRGDYYAKWNKTTWPYLFRDLGGLDHPLAVHAAKWAHPYACVDIKVAYSKVYAQPPGYRKGPKENTQIWRPLPVFKTGSEQTRSLFFCNNGLAAGELGARWHLRRDTPDGELIAEGEIPAKATPPCGHRREDITFTVDAPAGSKAVLVLETVLDGTVVFRDDRLAFPVGE